MYFDVLRCPRHCPRELIDAAVMFSYKHHGLPAELATEVKFVQKDGAFVGLCEYDEEEQMCWVSIYRNLYPSQIIRTLFHELTHVKDRIDGRLMVSEDLSIKTWDGVEYVYTEMRGEYNDQPWEVSANDSEDAMFAIFFEEMTMFDPKLASFLNDDWLDANTGEIL